MAYSFQKFEYPLFLDLFICYCFSDRIDEGILINSYEDLVRKHVVRHTRAWGYKPFFKLNLTEHKIYSAHKC